MSLPNFMAKYQTFNNLDQQTKGSKTWIWLNSRDDICHFVFVFLSNHVFVKLGHNGNLATSPGQYMCLPHCSLQVIYLYFTHQVLTVYDSWDQNVRKKVTLQTFLRIFCCLSVLCILWLSHAVKKKNTFPKPTYLLVTTKINVSTFN